MSLQKLKNNDDEESDYEDSEEESGNSEEVSLDEESHSEEDFDVGVTSTEDMMLFGDPEDEEERGGQTIVNKMAKLYKTGRLWVRGRDGKVDLKVGDVFSCKADLLRIMKDYCIQKGIFLKKIKNDKKKYTQVCMNNKCAFRIHASILIDGHSWMIKSFTDGHVCAVKEHHKRAGAAWVASHMLEEFRSNREMNATTVQKRMLTKFNTYIPNYTCWRALKLMRNMVEGRYEDGYKLLPQYLEVFKDRNPDSSCFIRWEEIGPGRNPIFRRCQICIGSAITSFKQFCRPLIGIDACHLKGPYQGILLTAMALDGNNGQFP
ncbi:unnamed protein product [Cuscuta campestris]|uniref:Transposase MuDR plant domain-containing protein n=1 Tax=Cuscuta campestris TaxID=132261 RepID=A0A484LXU4_9ASTE|nr:unnamed protein product [Cuscuta campestris]